MPHSRALLRLHGTCITKALALCVYGRRGLEIANATAILPHPVIPGSRYYSGLASLLSKVPGKSKVTNLQNTIPTADHIKNESISIMEQTAKFNLSTNTFSKFQMETGDTSGVLCRRSCPTKCWKSSNPDAQSTVNGDAPHHTATDARGTSSLPQRNVAGR